MLVKIINSRISKKIENKEGSRKRVKKVPDTPPYVIKNLKRTNQAHKNRGRRKLR